MQGNRRRRLPEGAPRGMILPGQKRENAPPEADLRQISRGDGMRTPAAILVFGLLATGAAASPIERACLGSDRGAGQRALCGCIQQAADMTLSTSDQRRAAGFFRNPQAAQDVRQSDRRSDEIFWDRYRRFGETAEAFCR